MKNRAQSIPPKGLSREARALWVSLNKEFDLRDAAAEPILRVALEAHDRMRECQAKIKEEGASTRDRWNQIRAHPLLSVERDSRAAFLAALKQLRLDLEPLRDVLGRPGGSGV